MSYEKKWVFLNIDSVEKVTEKAMLVKVGEEEVWLPKSQIKEDESTPNLMVISEWIAGEKGLTVSAEKGEQ